jgi:putative tricarboxylic transport membrane protein
MRERAWGLGFLVASGAYLAASLGFPLGDVAKPGPGFFPVGVGVFLCLAAAALMIGRRRGAPAGAGLASLSRDARARVSATVLGLVAFCLLLPWLGYPACALLFIALLLRRLGGAPWPGVVITAVLGALVSYYVFGVLLGVPLPTAPF